MSVTEVHITEPGASSSGDRSDSAAPVLSIATLLNDRQRYERMRRSLANSLELQTIQWLPIEADRLGLGATEALNHCLAEARAEWIVCAHQDVVFPHDWWRRARAQIAAWEHRTSRIVGVTGLVGVTRHGRFRGSITDPAGFGRWGPLPDRVLSVDEHVLLVRRATRLRFDPETPGFHCYGTDIALRALRDGFDVIAIDAPVSHFSTGTIQSVAFLGGLHHSYSRGTAPPQAKNSGGWIK